LLNNKDGVNIKDVFQEVLSEQKMYSLLMEHLRREFSIENLLFLTELVELQAFLLKYHCISNNEIFLNVKTPDFLQPSSIIEPFTKGNYSKILRKAYHNDKKSTEKNNEEKNNEENNNNNNNANEKSINLVNEDNQNIDNKTMSNEAKKRTLILNHIFVEFYDKYANRNRAPFEINISFSLFHELQLHYEKIIQNEEYLSMNPQLMNDNSSIDNHFDDNMASVQSSHAELSIEKLTSQVNHEVPILDDTQSNNNDNNIVASDKPLSPSQRVLPLVNYNSSYENENALVPWWRSLKTMGNSVLSLLNDSYTRFHFDEAVRSAANGELEIKQQ